jgi:putative phosphoribosyl transferase
LASLVEERDLGVDVVVLGLPRGGVPVAYEVATALDLPLDVIIVRKLGVPSQPELAMGAIGEGGARTIDDDVVAMAAVQSADLSAVEEREKLELERRAVLFRGDRPRLTLKGRTALIIDDGIATGSTARAACQVARAQGAARVVLATPVAPPRAVAELRGDADEVICLSTPELFWAIGEFYFDFTQTSDDEVTALLVRAADRRRESERSRLND